MAMDNRQNTLSLAYLEQLYLDYVRDSSSVPEEWRQHFAALGTNGAAERSGPTFQAFSIFNPPSGGNGAVPRDQLHLARLQERVDLLIRNYRVRGHIIAKIDPLGRVNPRPPELEPEYYGFTPEDLNASVSTTTIRGSNLQQIRAIIQRFEETYCGAIGAQFMHIDDLAARHWLQRRIENAEHRLKLTRAQQVRILTKLTDAVIFEEFVRTKYVGMKSFSLEGAETLIPLLDQAIEKLACQGVRDIAMSMSHRGRLNVLANTIGKNSHDIFREFEDLDADLFASGGDVKYHLGHHNNFRTASGHEVHISLGFNPSHLEFVNPVTLGRCRGQAGSVWRFTTQTERRSADPRRCGLCR